MQIIRQWLPLAVLITLLSGVIYTTIQQNYRQNANDPQIGMAEENASLLAQGAPVTQSLGSVDISKSLRQFIILYNEKKEPTASGAVLDGKIPQLPSGVLSEANTKGELRFTWEPKTGVRIATVVVPYNSDKSKGYVLVGRNMRDIEKREWQLELQVAAGWLGTLLATYLTVVVVSVIPLKKK